MNIAAFRWGRRAAHDPDGVRAMIGAPAERKPQTLDEIVARRADFLAAYQNAAYAERYRARVERVRAAERKAAPGSAALAEAVARNLFKAMAIKDEYEVARLYTDGSFQRQLAREFSGWDRLEFHLAPPVLARAHTDGRPRKSNFGPWMMTGFRILSALRGLRGTALDLFGYTRERREERRLLKEYEADLEAIAGALSPERMEAALALASIPSLIRGYGPVKAASAGTAEGERARLRERLKAGDGGAMRGKAA